MGSGFCLTRSMHFHRSREKAHRCCSGCFWNVPSQGFAQNNCWELVANPLLFGLLLFGLYKIWDNLHFQDDLWERTEGWNSWLEIVQRLPEIIVTPHSRAVVSARWQQLSSCLQGAEVLGGDPCVPSKLLTLSVSLVVKLTGSWW